MAGHSRYDVSNNDTGVDNQILKNKLSIHDKKRLHDTETLLLNDTYAHFFELLIKEEVTFDLSLLFSIHRYFLEPLYSWAGKIRTVDISKDGVLFAPVKYIHQALEEMEKLLKKKLPKQTDTKNEISQKLSLIHNECNVIHPFREGNGRTIRLFLDLLATHVGYDFIDWSKSSHDQYIKACIEGMRGNHDKMLKIITKGLKKRN